MAIYSTFFLCKPQVLQSGFPGWRPPLPEPISRQVKNPFTGEMMTIKTRVPEWPEDAEDDLDKRIGVVVGQGRYEDYLEGRLPQFVRGQSHWCAKNLTQVELDPLGEAAGFPSALDDALYCLMRCPAHSGGPAVSAHLLVSSDDVHVLPRRFHAGKAPAVTVTG